MAAWFLVPIGVLEIGVALLYPIVLAMDRRRPPDQRRLLQPPPAAPWLIIPFLFASGIAMISLAVGN